MKPNLNKKQVEEKIKEFFREKHDKEEVKKIKKLAMVYQIKLKELRKLFCKKCFSMNLKVKSIKQGMKVVECGDCKNVMRWKVKGLMPPRLLNPKD